MKKIILFVAINCLFLSINAQEIEIEQQINKHTAIVTGNDLFGVQYDGEIKIPLIYSGYDVMYGRIYLWKSIMKDDAPTALMGVANLNGELIIPVEYFTIEDNEANTGIFTVVKDGKHGVIDINGKILVPIEFERIDCFESSILAVGE